MPGQICRFYNTPRGCREGKNCRFEHPRSNSRDTNSNNNNARNNNNNNNNRGNNDSRNNNENRQNNYNNNQGQGQGRNPFDVGPLRNERQPRPVDTYRPQTRRNESPRDNRGHDQTSSSYNRNQGNDQARNLKLDAVAIKYDLTADLPTWPFSTYAGAGADATNVPRHFFNPKMEQSAEEIRCEYYLKKLQGQEGEAQQEEAIAHAAAMAEITEVRADIQRAVRNIIAAGNDHPNRWDIIEENNKRWNHNPNAFQPSQAPQTTAFNPSQITQQPSFGQTTQMGAPSSFGQPSQLDVRPPPFGQPSQPVASGPFGQPPTAGITPNPFGSGSDLRPHTSGFGHPSALGQPAPPFGQPPPAPTPFGAASTVPNPFGQPTIAVPFGQGSHPNGVAQLAAVGQNTPFNQPLAARPNPFGAPNPLIGMGAAAQMGQPSSSGIPFGQSTASSFAQHQHPVLNIPSGAGQAGRKVDGFGAVQNAFTFNSSVAYNTQPESATARDGDPPDEIYGSRKGEFREAYLGLLTTGVFPSGVMPEVAPVHNWVGWGPMESRFKP